MPNRSVPVPAFNEAAGASQTARQAIGEFVVRAIKHGLAPIPFRRAAANVTVFVPPLTDARVQAIAEEHGLTYQEAYGGLACAGAEQAAQDAEAAKGRATSTAIPFAAQPGQDVFYRSIRASLAAGRICLAEASTGIGKSRAMVAAALDAATANSKDGPVVIAAPTLAVLGGSLWREYESLVANDMPAAKRVRVGFLPGLGEFVDPEKIEDYLGSCKLLDEAPDAGVARWFAGGGKVVCDTPLTRALAVQRLPVLWLASDLRHVATNINPLDFACRALPPASEDRHRLGETVRALREKAIDCHVIFCTHAMLVTAKRSAWTAMPKPHALVIDEAHMFEQVATSVLSDNVSLYGLRLRLLLEQRARKGGKQSVPAKAQAALRELSEAVRTHMRSTRNLVPFAPDVDGYSDVYRHLASTAALLASRSLKSVEGIASSLSVIQTMLASGQRTDEAVGRQCYIQFSPDRRFPSLIAGAGSAVGFLRGLWRDATGGVVLASATLFTPDAYGSMRSDYMRRVLAVDDKRTDAPSPVIWSEITRIPTLHEPSAALAHKLARPSRDARTDRAETRWLKAVAGQVAAIAANASAGTLVLCASYAQVSAIAKHLAEPCGARVIEQHGNLKFAAFQERFIEAATARQRPVLVAVGVAWTGVNLTRHTPVKERVDDLLSDLVIACLPVGLNRTVSMLRRVERTGMQPVTQEATMLLRQGVGRLVRAKDARNKHLWMLDGRMQTPWPGMRPLQVAVRHTLAGYKKRVVFE